MSEIFHRITESIIAAIDADPTKPELPWHRAQLCIPSNASTGRPYRGINILSLWLTASAKGYPDARWASYLQWQALGVQVRKGEKGTPIVFYRSLEKDEPPDSETTVRSFRVARAYHVFNAAQVEGWTPPPLPTPLSETERQSHAEAFFEAVGATVIHEGDRAYYRPSTDTIHMPPFASFKSGLGYYAVLAHEHIHWTGAGIRLDRKLGTAHHTPAYAGEELVAELGAAFLCAALALTPEPRPDHAGYVASWLKLLRDDHRAIVQASSLATRAVEFLHVKAEERLHDRPPSVAAA
jgi:antirestriction protein ArdC